MSVYIPGMEMPKSCVTCPYCDRAWNKPKCKAKSVQGRFMEQRLNLDRTRQKWCPLIPVPEHGPLVDALEVINAFPEEFIFTNEQARALTNYIIPADPADKDGEG